MKKYIFKIIVFCFLSIQSVFAGEFIDGRIKLIINEKSGRFSLYYMTDIANEEYLPFFVDQDQRTSFLSIMLKNQSYKMGDSSLFKTSLGGTPSSPSLVFESTFLVVTENFSFIKTGSSPLTNGVLITITVTNKGEQPIDAGIRFMLDTFLGEKNPPHFTTDVRQINNELLIDGSFSDQFWVSKNNRLALMGSIEGKNLTRPDLVLFSNWKRLNDTAWKIPYIQGRSFNLLPYSIDDSAVCYFYDPVELTKGSSRVVSFMLSSEDQNSFTLSNPFDISMLIREMEKIDDDFTGSIRNDLVTLRDLIVRLDYCVSGGIEISNEELSAIGLLISRIKSKYSIP